MRIANDKFSSGYGMNKFHCNLGALLSLWLNESHQSFLFDQTGRFQASGRAEP
jgi:hypothetical protein